MEEVGYGRASRRPHNADAMTPIPNPDWLRALRDAGWVLLVLGVLAVAFLVVTGYGEGVIF